MLMRRCPVTSSAAAAVDEDQTGCSLPHQFCQSTNDRMTAGIEAMLDASGQILLHHFHLIHLKVGRPRCGSDDRLTLI